MASDINHLVCGYTVACVSKWLNERLKSGMKPVFRLIQKSTREFEIFIEEVLVGKHQGVGAVVRVLRYPLTWVFAAATAIRRACTR